uniref:Calpain catalytic domain-containing protein n=1 Tax=Steinernema glaseri TaxID=37863 RepID=A0A1I8APM2_9BILA
MRMVDTPEGKVPLLRIRNPWGNAQEWNGDWSDDSGLWDDVSSSQKKEMNLVLAHDGEFWMNFDDFMKHYDKMEICNLGPDVMEEINGMTGVDVDETMKGKWNTRAHFGVWSSADGTAGGCRNYLRQVEHPRALRRVVLGRRNGRRLSQLLEILRQQPSIRDDPLQPGPQRRRRPLHRDRRRSADVSPRAEARRLGEPRHRLRRLLG